MSTLSALLAATSAEESGQIFGIIFWGVLLVAGLLKCRVIAQRPTANKLACYGLAVGLLCLLIFMSIGASGIRSAGFLGMSLGLVTFGLVFVGFVLSIVGLAQIWRAPMNRYKQGIGQGITGLLIAAILGGLGVYGFVSRLQRDGIPKDFRLAENSAEAVKARVPGQSGLTFDDFNFRLTAAGRPWVQIDAKRVNPVATAAFMRASPQIFMCIIAEKTDAKLGLESRFLADIAIANMKSAAESASVVDDNEHSVNGLKGILLRSNVQIGKLNLIYLHWVTVHKGFSYQCVFWTSTDNAKELRANADEFLKGFNLIDASRTAYGAPLADVHSDAFGFDLSVAKSDWVKWNSATDYPEAAESFSTNGGHVLCSLVPVHLGKLNPNFEAVIYAMLQTLNIAYPDDAIQNRRSINAQDVGLPEKGALPPGVEGCVMDFTRAVDGKPCSYRFTIIRNGPTALMLSAWHFTNGKDNEADSRAAADAARILRISTPSPEGVPVERMNARELNTQVVFLNQLGHYYYNAKDYVRAAEFYQASFERSKNDAVLIGNWVVAMHEGGKSDEALIILDKYIDRFPKISRLRSRRANLLHENGRTDEAIRLYSELFAEGHDNSDDFDLYVQILRDNKQSPRAVEEIEKRRAKKDTNALAILHAITLADSNEHDKAIGLLEARLNKIQYHPELAYALIGHCSRAERYNDGLKICQTLMEKGFDSAKTWLEKGRLEYRLKWFTEAKTSFESAARKAPKDEVIKSWLDSVSGMLGEGQNSNVKNPIAPVALPEAWLKPTALDTKDPYLVGHNAVFLRRITAISYKKGKEYRTTENRLIKILDASGVSRFSSLQFTFDPLQEELFVNSLVIRDAQGAVLTTGKASDYYVIDEGGEIASQRKDLNIPVPGLQPGCTVDVTVTRRALSAPMRMDYIEHFMSGTVPILFSAMLLSGDIDDVAFSSPIGVTPSDAITPEGRGRAWITVRPAVYAFESSQPDTRTYLPLLVLNQRGSKWEEVAREYMAKIQDALRADPELEQIAREKTKGLNDDETRLAALHEYLCDNYTYKAIAFGRRAFIPNTSAVIRRNKFGDCKDHSVLMHLMLQSLKIESHLALVGGVVQEDMPSIDTFNHMIVYIPSISGHSRFYDGTDKEMDPRLPVPYGLANRHALVLDPKNPRVEKIGAYSDSGMTLRLDRTLTVLPEGDVDIEEILTYSGYFAVSLRQYLKPIEPSKRKEALQNDLRGVVDNVRLEKVEINQLESRSEPLVLKYRYTCPKVFRSVGQQSIGALPLTWEKYYLSGKRESARKTPFEVYWPLHFDCHATLKLPEGYSLEPGALTDRTESNAGIAWSRSVKSGKDATQIHFNFKRAPTRFKPEEVEAHYKTIEEATSAVGQHLILNKK